MLRKGQRSTTNRLMKLISCDWKLNRCLNESLCVSGEMKSRCRLAIIITAASHSFVLCFPKNSKVPNLRMPMSPRMNAPDFPGGSKEKNKQRDVHCEQTHFLLPKWLQYKQMESVPGITNMNRSDCVGGRSAFCSPASSPWRGFSGVHTYGKQPSLTRWRQEGVYFTSPTVTQVVRLLSLASPQTSACLKWFALWTDRVRHVFISATRYRE